MAIAKAVNQAPAGITALVEEPEEATEIVIENEDGSVDVTLPPESRHDENLAEQMDENDLLSLGNDLKELFDMDLISRRDWEKAFRDGLEVLGFKYEDRTEPWDKACGVFSTVLSESIVRFQAEAILETFPAAGPVKTKIIGEETPQKKQAANRVKEDMNHRLTDTMKEYRSEHERLLFSYGLAGSGFKKIYFDEALGREVAIFVPAEDVVVPYGASTLENAERISHIMRLGKNDFIKAKLSGRYRDVDLGDPVTTYTDVDRKKAEDQGYVLTTDNRHHLVEMQVEWDLKGFEHKGEDGEPTGLGLPYVITFDLVQGIVLSIRRNWEEGDKHHTKLQHFSHYVYIPGFGFYGYGLIHLVGGYAKAGTSLIRQLVDAGTLSNLPGGLKTRGLRILGENKPIEPGEWRDVDVPGDSIANNIMPLPYKEPSATLLQLLDKIVEDGRRLAATSDMNISDMSAQMPVGTTLALLERTLKLMSAVNARAHNSLKEELALIKRLVAKRAPETYDYEPEGGLKQAIASDYASTELIPVSDPNSSTMAQRVVQYQAAIEMSERAPEIYNKPILHKEMLDVLGIKNAAKIIPLAEDPQPMDPISENMAILSQKPVKAFITQDHAAHLQAHMSFLGDPLIAARLGQSPQAQQMQGAGMAHIAEHLAFLYRSQIEERLGTALPPPGEPIPPEIEVQLSKLVAAASQQVLQINTATMQQQKAQELAQDPMIQLEMRDMDIKEREVARKEKKDKMDASLKALEIDAKDGVDVEGEQQLKALELEYESQKNQLDMAHQERMARIKEEAVMRKAQVDGAAMEHKANIQSRVADQQAQTKMRTTQMQAQQSMAVGEVQHQTKLQQAKEAAAAQPKPTKPAAKKATAKPAAKKTGGKK